MVEESRATDSQRRVQKGLLLTLGQVGSVAVSFFVPVFLSRWLTVESYGTYKLLILIQWFLLMTLHFGMDFGLFYFIRKDPKAAPLYSLNASLFELAVACLIALALWLLRAPLGSLFHNPEISTHMGAFALLVIFSIPAQHFEHYLMVLDRIRLSVAVNLCFEALKAAAIIGTFASGASLDGVLMAMAGVSLLKLAALIAFNLARLARVRAPSATPAVSLMWALFRGQWGYAAPLGSAQLLSVLLRLDRLVISALFSPRQFALYAVGCLDIPLIPYYINAMNDLMSFEMVEGPKGTRAHDLWRDTKRKTWLLQVPVALYLFVFAPLVITLIYGDRYAESAEYFRWFLLIFIVSALDSEILFRVFAQNRLLLRIQTVSGALTAAGVIGGAYYLGPTGALAGKLATDLFGYLAKLQVIKSPLQLSWRAIMPWRYLAGLIVVGLSSASFVHLFSFVPNPFGTLVFSFASYALLFVAIAVITGLIPRNDLRAASKWLGQSLARWAIHP